MAAAHELSALDARMDGKPVVCNWVGLDRVAHFIEAAAALAQVDPVDYGLLERRNEKTELCLKGESKPVMCEERRGLR
jgi:hypothetical protein